MTIEKQSDQFKEKRIAKEKTKDDKWFEQLMVKIQWETYRKKIDTITADLKILTTRLNKLEEEQRAKR